MPTEFVDQAVDRIVARVLALGEREIPSREVGEMVMQELYLQRWSVTRPDFRAGIRAARERVERAGRRLS